MDFIFVDTSAWYALVDRSDLEHRAAKGFLGQLSRPLLTTDFIVDETITLVRYKLGHELAAKIGKKLWGEEIAKLLFIDRGIEQRAWELFLRYKEHKFSFTDCTSFVVMEQLGLHEAFAFDSDLEAYGRFATLP